LELNGTHQLLVYADSVNILGKNIHTIKKHTNYIVPALVQIHKKIFNKKFT